MPKKLFVFAVVIISFLIFNCFPTKADYSEIDFPGKFARGETTLKTPSQPPSVDVDLVGKFPWRVGRADGALDVFVKGNYAYVAGGGVFSIVNIYSRGNPKQISQLDMPGWEDGVQVSKHRGWAIGIYVVGHYAYVAAGHAGLRIIKVSNPSSPFEVGHCDTPGFAHKVYVSGNYAYVAGGNRGLRIIDISNPFNPTEVGYYEDYGSAYDVYVSEDYAYVADSSAGLRIIDIFNPANPIEVGYYDTAGAADGVYVLGNYAYVTDGTEGLRIINVSDPSSPTEIAYCDTPGYAWGVKVAGSHAYVADTHCGLRIIDISDPFNPSDLTETGHYNIPSHPKYRTDWVSRCCAHGVYVSGDYVYVADYPCSCYTSLLILKYNPAYSIKGYAKEFRGTNMSGVPVTLASTGGTKAVSPTITKVTSTDGNGYYEFTNFPPGNYTVTASKPGYRFASYTISPTQSKVSRSLIAYPTIYSIKGCVRDAAGNEVNDVTVNLSGKSAIEPSTSTGTVTLNGHYELKNLIIGNYKIIVSKPGWSFTPSSKSYTWLNSALDNQDFMAIPIGVEQGEVKIVGGEKGYVNPGDNETARIFFKPEPFGSTVNIKIYTLRGQLVWEKTMEVSGGNQEVIEWACKNAEGESVASGIYLIYVKGAGINVRKKIAIIR